MVAFANEWGWWALPLAVAAGVAAYWWWSSSRSSFGSSGTVDFVTVEEVRRRFSRGEEVLMVDVRSESAYSASVTAAKGAIRLDPARAVDEARARNLPADAAIVTYCA